MDSQLIVNFDGIEYVLTKQDDSYIGTRGKQILKYTGETSQIDNQLYAHGEGTLQLDISELSFTLPFVGKITLRSPKHLSHLHGDFTRGIMKSGIKADCYNAYDGWCVRTGEFTDEGKHTGYGDMHDGSHIYVGQFHNNRFIEGSEYYKNGNLINKGTRAVDGYSIGSLHGRCQSYGEVDRENDEGTTSYICEENLYDNGQFIRELSRREISIEVYKLLSLDPAMCTRVKLCDKCGDCDEPQ